MHSLFKSQAKDTDGNAQTRATPRLSFRDRFVLREMEKRLEGRDADAVRWENIAGKLKKWTGGAGF